MNYNFQKNIPIDQTKEYLTQSLHTSYSQKATESITEALSVASYYHKGQLRSDGSAYIIHPMRVALMLMVYEKLTTPEMLIAALLHDTLEDTKLSKQDIGKRFGQIVLSYVLGVTERRSKVESKQARKNAKVDSWKKIMKSNHEIRTIKTFDNLDNLICIKFISPDRPHARKIPRWLMETQTLSLPLALKTNEKAYKLMELEINHYINQGFKIGDWYSD